MSDFDSEKLKTLLPMVIEAATKAGRAIMEIYEQADLGIAQKEDKTPVTAADYAAHRIILERLSEIKPTYPTLSEESESIPYAERSKWQTYWLIDPLDGTREFIKRNGEFTVNIALIHAHEPVLGVVYAPALGILYEAAKGLGARRHDRDGQIHPMHTRKTPTLPVIAGSRSHAGPHLSELLERIGEHEFISMGSALKTCMVAEGRADLYPRLGLTSEWDTAAAQCVLEEAGGQLTDIHGRHLRYNTKESLLNPHFLAFGDPEQDWTQFCPSE